MPWRSTEGQANRNCNEHAFEQWYNKMVAITRNVSKVPLTLLDRYAHPIWFGISHSNSYVWPLTINPTTFSMRKMSFYLNENAFHNEVLSWPGIITMQKDGEAIYLFDGMHPKDSVDDAPSSSWKCSVDTNEDLQPIMKKVQERISFAHMTWSEVGFLVHKVTTIHVVATVSLAPPTVTSTLPLFTNATPLSPQQPHKNPKPSTSSLIDRTDEGVAATSQPAIPVTEEQPLHRILPPIPRLRLLKKQSLTDPILILSLMRARRWEIESVFVNIVVPPPSANPPPPLPVAEPSDPKSFVPSSPPNSIDSAKQVATFVSDPKNYRHVLSLGAQQQDIVPLLSTSIIAKLRQDIHKEHNQDQESSPQGQSEKSVANRQPLQARFPLSDILSTDDLQTWSSLQLFQFIRASTTQLEDCLVHVE